MTDTQGTGPHWVELRIHGVSGTPPEDMLSSAHARQVAGDAWGRFFRPVDSLDRELQTPGRILEGYHWGHFTSGSWRQGLWLLLVPFGFLNAAAFMVPDPGSRRVVRAWHAVVGGLVRGIGIGLTCTFALSASLILVNLLAWQSSANLGWLERVPHGVVLAAGVVAAAAVMLGLHQMGNQNRGDMKFDDSPGSLAETGDRVGLTRTLFFRGNPDAPLLGRLHLTAAWAVVALIGALTARTIAEERPALVVLRVSLVLLGVVTLVTVLLGDPERSVTGAGRHERWHTVVDKVSPVFALVAAASVVGAAALLAGTDRRPLVLDFDDWSRYLAASMAGTVIVLLVACAVLAVLTKDESETAPQPFRRYARGMAPWAASATGLFLGVGFCGSFVLGVAKALGVTAQTALVYRVAYAWGLTMMLLAVVVLLGAGRLLRTHRRFVKEARASYENLSDGTTPLGVSAGWHPRIAFAQGIAGLKHRVPVVFMVCALGGLAMTVATTVEMFWGDLPPAVGWLSGDLSDGAFARFAINLGTYALIALAGLLFFLGRRALRTERARRGANVVWDVVSFWPHSAHPFVPPAYSQFAVRDLRRRIRFHLGLLDTQPPEGPATCVVVAAHSQGSLIAFATMLWLEPEARDRVGLVTYGSQLQVAFPRAFPAYVNFDLIERVHEALGRRWVNLYRDTDPIAGPVLSWGRTPITRRPLLSTGVGKPPESPDTLHPRTGRRESGWDWRVLDPMPSDRQVQLGAVTRMQRHSGFPSTQDFRDAVAQVHPAPMTPAAADPRAGERPVTEVRLPRQPVPADKDAPLPLT